MVDNFHTWKHIEKVLGKLNFTFLDEKLGYRIYRGLDGHALPVKKSDELPMEYVVNVCEDVLGITYRAFLMLAHDDEHG